MDRKFMIMKTKLVQLYTMYMYMTVIVKQVYYKKNSIYPRFFSGERLQDHWSSGSIFQNRYHFS